MTLKQTLKCAREALLFHNFEDAALEAELLLRHTLKMDRAQLYLELERELSPKEEQAFWQLVERHLRNEPIAYIVTSREFYGLDFYVNQDTLIPRPESELLVEKVLDLAKYQPLSTVAEIGTGCGAIAISLALHLPRTKIYATDISVAALEVALANCYRHGVADRVLLLAGDMLEPLPEPVDLIVANLPYVKKSELSGLPTFNFEPSLALDGGPDGLEKIRQLATKIETRLGSVGYLLLEIGLGQLGAVITLLHDLFPLAKIEVTPDLAGIERVVMLTSSSSSRLKTVDKCQPLDTGLGIILN